MSAQNGHSSYNIILDGETVAQVGDDLSPASQQGYTGHVGDNTGLVYMQARYYDPVIGRFYSNDPIGFRDVHSFNRYAYANNNPYKYIDPNGEFAVPWHGGITFFAAWSSGHSFGESLSIAYRAMQADWEAGSQGSSPSACARHAMECPNSSPGEARLLHAQLINGALADGDLGLAAHAIQDQFASGHSDFAFWPGGFKELGFWGTIKHLFSDIFPSFSAVSNSYSATKQALTGKQNNSGSGSSQSGASSGRASFTVSPDDRCGIACTRGTIQEELRRRGNVIYN